MSPWARRGSLPLLVLSVLLFATGCSKQAAVWVSFDGPVSVRAGGDVVSSGRVVGEVRRVAGRGGHTRVYLTLDRTGGLVRGAAALIVEHDGDAAVEVLNFRAGKQPVADGDRLEALNGPVEQIAWQSREALAFAHGSLASAASSFEHWLESRPWEAQGQAIERRARHWRTQMDAAVADMGRRYEALVGALRERTAESIARVESRVERFMRRGEAVIVDPLRRLLEVLQGPNNDPGEQRKTTWSA